MIARLLAWLRFQPPTQPAPEPAPATVLVEDLHADRLTHGELCTLLWAALRRHHPEPTARGKAMALVIDWWTDGPQGEA